MPEKLMTYILGSIFPYHHRTQKMVPDLMLMDEHSPWNQV